jgi:transposase
VDSVCPLSSNRARVSVGETCKILVLNGLNSPRPLYKVEDWADHVSIIDLFGIPSALLNDDKLGRCLELLATYSDDIEALLCLKLIRDFGVSPELVIWDGTSFYFEGTYDDSESVTFGYALEGKTDAKRVRVGICMDADTGIPLTSSREPGRRGDAEMVVDNVETLKATLSKASRADYVVVADRALANVDNVFLLDSRNMKFVAPADDDACYIQLVLNTGDDEFQEADYRPKDGEPFFIAERGICLHRELEAEGPERPDGSTAKRESKWFRAIVVKSPSKLKVDRMKRSKETETIDAWLRDVRDSKINKYRYKRLGYVEKRIDAFFSGPLRKYRKIYNPKVVGDDDRLAITWFVDEQGLLKLIALDGKYVVISNQMDPAVSAADIFCTSRKRSRIETPMRYLKSQLKVRPAFLESDMRIRGLAFATNLALVVYCLLERMLVESISWCKRQ